MFLAHDQSGYQPSPNLQPRSRAKAGPQGPEIILDLSRLLSRALHPLPSGVDRVEMAYARTLQRLIPDRLCFGAVHPIGIYGRLPFGKVTRFLDETEAHWERGGGEIPSRRYLTALSQCLSLCPLPVRPRNGPRVLLQASPHHLHRRPLVAEKLAAEQARFVCLVHDLIPITHPEYARPGGAELHKRRMSTLLSMADGLLANSRATAEVLQAYAGDLLSEKLRVAPLGTRPISPRTTDGAALHGNYFLCVATIEPRKNHLLLLQLWRSLVESLGPDRTPKLILVGRRGWENENVLDILDRCDQLKSVVQELPCLPDKGLRSLMQPARALLMPSFTEGFGMPVAEALAAGVPVLASDIPAHREAGGSVPDYIDPIDGATWRSTILDYCALSSVKRRAHLERMAQWQPETWDSHVEVALTLAEEVACRAI